jgi:RHS repeat-associated protein
MVVNSDAIPAKRYSFYSPEMNLLSESALTTDPAPTILYDYVWFNGHPVGQVNGGTQWTFTDHLGTPLIQTNATGDVFWQAEYEPYGRVFTLRTTPQHQPLRLPGQESEELNLSADGNGASERFYNIFRWYRPSWGRYSQSDPIGLVGGENTYRYSEDDPVSNLDPSGLKTCRCDRRIDDTLSALTPTLDPVFHHSFVQIVPDGTPCGGLNGLAYGFQRTDGGRVLPERTPTVNPQLKCKEVPCIDEAKLRNNIAGDIHSPPFAYKGICRIGKGWNRLNCQGWADDVLARSRTVPCCP